MNRFLINLILLISLLCVGSCAAQDRSESDVKLGNAHIALPAGWSKNDSDKYRVNITSADGRQQATISILTFEKAPTFSDFKRICSERLDAERAEASDISVVDDTPFEDGETFGMFFSGREAGNGRLFSGFISQKGNDLLTIYLEGVGIEKRKHLESFEAFVKGVSRR